MAFTEMFCPEWERGLVFLSHVGEINFSPNLIEGKARLIDKTYLINGSRTVVAVGRYKPGRAVLVNLTPANRGSLRLICVSGAVVGNEESTGFEGAIHGWFKPDSPLEQALARFSYLGGTHHCILVYGDRMEDLAEIGRILGWDVQTIL